ALPGLPAVQREVPKQVPGRQRIQKGFGRSRDGTPRLQNLGERRGAHRGAECKALLNFREEHDALGPVQQVALLLPSEMADDPADRVHLTAVHRGVRFSHAGKASTPLASSEPKLLDNGVGHWLRHPSSVKTVTVTRAGPRPA